MSDKKSIEKALKRNLKIKEFEVELIQQVGKLDKDTVHRSTRVRIQVPTEEVRRTFEFFSEHWRALSFCLEIKALGYKHKAPRKVSKRNWRS